MEQSTAVWVPPNKIEELYEKANSGNGHQWTAINAPTSGARNDNPLPNGTAPFQLYSLGTPNGWKVSIMLEELGIDYDAHTYSIGQGQQFDKGFVQVNPNSKIPCAIDRDGPGGQPIHLFESAAIVLYLAEKYGYYYHHYHHYYYHDHDHHYHYHHYYYHHDHHHHQ